MMPSFYTPPPSGGSQWSQPIMLHRPSSTVPQENAQLQSHASPTTSQTPFASMMMQQMLQNYSFSMPNQQPHYMHSQQQQQQQPHTPAPTFDQPEMRTPQPSDNALLAQILYEQTKRGHSYKVALESLHGHNGIMAFAWKDYFLENKQTIDALVDHLARQAPSTSAVGVEEGSRSPMVKNGSRHSPGAERQRLHSVSQTESRGKSRASEERSVSIARSISRRGKSKEATPARTVKIKEGKEPNGRSKHEQKAKENATSAPSRRTLNSLSSAPSNDLLAKIPPAVVIDDGTGLPAAPSRSPSPPQPGPNSRYTEQDAIFFFRRIAYDLARNPDLTKAGLCEILGEEAPHHSALSWRAYWQRHEDVADKMFLLTQLDQKDREAAIQSWKGKPSVSTANAGSRSSRKVSYKESSESELTEASGSDASSESEDRSSDSSEEDDSDAQGSTDDEAQLGGAGSAFTIAEKRVLAKHIAIIPDWFNGRREWESFFVAHPQRSSAAWREYYRRKADEIDALAKKYVRKAKKTKSSINAQRGRPSWARDSTLIKRKLEDDGSREQSEEKRSKTEDLKVISLPNFPRI